MSLRFANAPNNLRESRYLPEMEQWLGFKKGYVEIPHQGRSQGKSIYTFLKKLTMAFQAIISFSDLRQRITAALGFGLVFVGFILISPLSLQMLFCECLIGSHLDYLSDYFAGGSPVGGREYCQSLHLPVFAGSAEKTYLRDKEYN